MPAIAPFQQPNKTGGITTYGGVSEQDAFNQFYPRSLQGSPVATPTTGATETAANAVNAAAQAVQQATTTPTSSPRPLVGSWEWMQANIAAAPKPTLSAPPTKGPDYATWWMNFLRTNPESFRNTIIGMSGQSNPYGGAPRLDSSGFAGGLSAAQGALDEYARLYGRSPTDMTEAELTDLATQSGLGGYAFGTAGMSS